MSLQKQVGIKVTTKSDTGGLDKAAASADRFAKSVNNVGRQARGVKQTQQNLEQMASRATMAFGVVAGGAIAMDKVIMGQAKYNALLKNAPFSIDAASKATQGYISQTALLESAIASNRAGFIKSGSQYAEFAADVQKLAMATGEDTTEAMNVLTRALAKNESELLDNYNINLKVRQAQEMYAEQIGKTVSALTEEEKATAFGIIGMQKIKEVASKANVELDAHTAAWLKLKATIMDFPKLMSDASDAIYENMVALDEWQLKVAGELRGEAMVMGDHRRGTGFKNADKHDFATAWLIDNERTGPMLKRWMDDQVSTMIAQSEILHEHTANLFESAAKDRLIGPKKKGGRKKKFEWSAEIQNEIRMSSLSELMGREGSDSRDFAAGLQEARLLEQMRVANEAAIKGVAELELRKAEATLEARQLGLELAAERGLDPLSLADGEMQAQQKMLDAKERYIAATMQGTERLMAMEDLHAERRKVQHSREVAAIRAEMKTREQQSKRMQAMGDSIVDVHAGVAAAAIQGAFASDMSVKAAVAGFAKAKAIEMTILAATEGIKAIAAAASFNFVSAQAHGTAAAMAAAEAGVLFGLAGATGAFSGGGGGGRNRALGNGGSLGGRDRPSSQSNAGAPPISRTNPAPQPLPPTTGSSDRAPTNITVINQSLLPQNVGEQMIQLRRLMARSERDNPGPV